MPALRKFTFRTAGAKTGTIEETAAGSIWLGAVGFEAGQILLTPEHTHALIRALLYFEQNGRLPEEVSQGVIPQ